MSGAGEDDAADKSFEPTPEKLRKARDEGQVAKSTDLNTAIAYFGMVLCAFIFGKLSIERSASALMHMLDYAPEIASNLFQGNQSNILGPLLFGAVSPLSVWFFLPAVLVLLALLVQRVMVVTPKNVKPKLSRISILKNAKNKFGRNGLFETGKSFVKLVIFATVAGVFMASHGDDLVGSARLDHRQLSRLMATLARGLLIYIVVIAGIIGLIDFLWQKAEHTRKNMMSRKEITDEQKASEGDPQLKGQRRQRAQEIALNQMLSDVPSADVVIVNPTHFAVALAWDRRGIDPPKCVAKGVDEIAAKIRELAQTAAVPIHSDPPTARALYATVDIDQLIDPDHFAAVAAAIRYADAMRDKARRS